MNDYYYLSETDPFQLVDDVGLIDDVFDQAEIDDSLRMDLGDSNWNRKLDTRQHKRYQIDENAFALIRSIHTGPLKIYGKSMGCIACAVFNAKPAKLGKIDNLSMGGLMFHHVDSKTQLSKSLVLDILLADCGFYLANLPFKIITDVVVPDEVYSDAIEWRQVRIQFLRLNTLQLAKLNTFIIGRGIF